MKWWGGKVVSKHPQVNGLHEELDSREKQTPVKLKLGCPEAVWEEEGNSRGSGNVLLLATGWIWGKCLKV